MVDLKFSSVCPPHWRLPLRLCLEFTDRTKVTCLSQYPEGYLKLTLTLTLTDGSITEGYVLFIIDKYAGAKNIINELKIIYPATKK